jgi:hypothetical protein
MAVRLKTTLSKTALISLIQDKYCFMNGDKMPKVRDISFMKRRGTYWLKWHALNDFPPGGHYKATLETCMGKCLLHVERKRNVADWCDSDCEPCTCKRKSRCETDTEHIEVTYDELSKLGWLSCLKDGELHARGYG